MADFDSEELRRIFQNLGDRLANTKGDENIVDKLAAVEKAINKLDKSIDAADKKSKAEQKKDRDDLIRELIKELNNMPVLNEIKESLEEQGENGSGPGQGRIAQEYGNLKGFSSAVGQSILAFGKFSSSLADAAVGVVDRFSKLDGSMKNFATTLGLGEKAAVVGLLGMIDHNVDAFRRLIETSEGTIGSVMDLREAMSKTSLGAEEFSKAISEGTKGTRLMGAQPWAQLYSSIKQQTKDMAYYGYTTQGLIKASNEYLEIVSSRGDIFNQKTLDNLPKSLDRLLQVNTDVAYILGQTRDQAMAESIAQSRDADVQAFMRTFGDSPEGDDQKFAAETAIKTFTAIDQNLGAIAKDLLMLDGNLQLDTSKIAALLPTEFFSELQDLMVALGRGEVSSKEVAGRIQELTKVYTANMSDDTLRQSAQLATMGQEQFKALNQIDQGLRNVRTQNPEDAETGNTISDAFSEAMLASEQMIKDLAATGEDILTQFVFGPLTEFGDYIKSGFENIDGFIQKLRDTVAYLGTFDSAIKLIAGVLVGGALLNGVAGIVTSVVGSVFAKQIFKFVGLIAGPIASLTKGIFGLSKALGSSLVKAIATAVSFAIGKIPGLGGGAAGALGKVGGLAARAAPVAAAGIASYEAGRMGGEGLAGYLMNNHPEAAAWISENIFGNEVDPKALEKAKELSAKGESVTDYANSVDQPEEEPKEKVNSAKTDEEKALEESGYRKDPMLDEVSKNLAAISKDAQVLASTSEVKTPEIMPINPQALSIEQIENVFKQQNLAMSNLYVQAQGILERIYQTLKQTYEYNKENDQVVRDRLAELNKLQEDLVRVTKR